MQKEKNKEVPIPKKWEPYIFHNTHGLPIRESATTVLKKITKAHNLPVISMHNLRHTFATRCIEANMKPKALQKILGHSNINMTMNLYVHITEDEKINEMKKIENLLNLIGTKDGTKQK